MIYINPADSKVQDEVAAIIKVVADALNATTDTTVRGVMLTSDDYAGTIVSLALQVMASYIAEGVDKSNITVVDSKSSKYSN